MAIQILHYSIFNFNTSFLGTSVFLDNIRKKAFPQEVVHQNRCPPFTVIVFDHSIQPYRRIVTNFISLDNINIQTYKRKNIIG